MQKKEDRYMCMVKLGPKGQIVIPKEVRDLFGIGPSDRLMLLADRDRGIALQKPEMLAGIADTIFAAASGAGAEDKTFAQAVKETIKEEEDDG